MIGDDKDFFREGLREVEGHLGLSDNDTYRAFGGSARQCRQLLATLAQWRELSSSTREVDERNTQGNTDSLLSHGEITGDFDVKDHNDGNHFLAGYVDSKVAARTYLDQKTKKRCK